MSAAHTCARSALIQTFRPFNGGITASCSVPLFLVPALSCTSKRPFSRHPRTSKRRSPPLPPTIRLTDSEVPRRISEPIEEQRSPRIPIPSLNGQHDIFQWLQLLEPVLPIKLQRGSLSKEQTVSPVTPIDIAIYLGKAQKASHDILSHLGLVEGRWDAVVWLAKKIVEDGRRPSHSSWPFDSENIVWPETGPGTLKSLTESPIRLARPNQRATLHHTCEDSTAPPSSLVIRPTLQRRALGTLWRSLGNMILAAAASSTDESAIMPHVLEVIAHLHHTGFMPESVYTFQPTEDKYALQQPPTLHMMSSKILTALSDATWRAHEASVKSAENQANKSYFLGHEIPGSRYKLKASELVPEIWLELVLWSCLHGEWTMDGVAILEQLASKKGDDQWELISWREILHAERAKITTPSRIQEFLHKVFSVKEDLSAGPEDRLRTRRKISSEVVTAHVDGLVSDMRLSVGTRGMEPEPLIESLIVLKGFLDSNSLSLGSTTWDALMVRLLESGGIVPEKRPESVIRMFDLAAGYGAEVSAANASVQMETEAPYFFEPTTVPLSLLHRAIRTSLGNGDIHGALACISRLQHYTDDNKRKSMEQFFAMLKSLSKEDLFSSQTPPIEFPAFDANLPVPLLANLLDLATDSTFYDVGRWLISSKDIDGPLIGPDLYTNRNIAASLVRFGTLAGDNDLVLDVVNKVGIWNEQQQQQRMPDAILAALFCCQVKLRRWESVGNMQNYVKEAATYRPQPYVLASFAAELLRMSGEPVKALTRAQEAFASLLFDWESLILKNIPTEFNTLLAIMSTVSEDWHQYAARFLPSSSRQDVQLSTDDFNQVLSGVLDGYGSARGIDTVDRWCYTHHKHLESYRAPGGLPTMSQYRPLKGLEHMERLHDIEILQESGARIVLRGRLYPNRHTIRSVLRKAQEEFVQMGGGGQIGEVSAVAELHQTTKWATLMLEYLGLDKEDVSRDLGSLSNLVPAFEQTNTYRSGAA